MNKGLKYFLISIGVTSAVIGIYMLLKKLDVIKQNDNIQSNKVLNSILFVGDSITAGVGYSYSYLIKNDLPNKQVDILALGGMQTSWMLQNLPAQLAKSNYDRVYIYGGVNDIFSGVSKEQATANVQAMVDLINGSGAEAVVISGYDSEVFMTANNLKPTIYVTTVDGMLQMRDSYAAYQDYLQNNIQSAVVLPEFELDPSLNTDGIHPNAAAHKIIEQILLQDIS